MEEQKLTSLLGAGPDCLSIDRLGRYADGALSDAERGADESHISSCANCQAELTLLHAFAAIIVKDDEAAIVRAGVDQLRRRESEIFEPLQPEPASWRQWLSIGRLRPAMALAVVLLAVLSGYYLVNPSAPRLPADIGSGSEATRSMGISTLEPLGDLREVPTRLRWQPVEGASRYHVRLTEVDRHEMWSGDTTNTTIDLPADVQARIVPAKTLLWQVAAYGAGPTPLVESSPQRFRLTR